MKIKINILIRMSKLVPVFPHKGLKNERAIDYRKVGFFLNHSNVHRLCDVFRIFAI